MPTKKATTRPGASEAERARCEENDRVIGRIAGSIEVAQADLGKLGGSLGTGVSDLRRDLAKLLRDARRDVTKMSKATRRDLEKLQKDLAKAAKAEDGRRRPSGAGAKRATAAGRRPSH